MHPLDLAVVAGWLALTLVAGLWFSRRAGASTESFFVSDRSLPWWVVGTSMVATTFAADTPLVVAGLALKGLHANWFWWMFGMSGTTAVFLFARLWRRARILTDAELVEIRYGSPLGGPLRAVKAIWFGVFMNLLVVAWVMRAMTKLLVVALGIPEGAVVFGVGLEVVIVLALFALTVAYTTTAGLYGVVATDVVQFVVAMGAAVLLAVLCWTHIGGREGLEAGFLAHDLDWDALTRIAPLDDPDPGGATAQMLVLLGVVWWGRTNVEGGGYLAQRLFAAKDDRHAFFAYLWFTVAHICLRPWPWIVVGLTGVALLGPLDDPELYYPKMMVDLLPPGLLGLMLASFLAAFMSTIDTQLNWSASLLINDVYRRWLRPGLPDVHYVKAARWAIVGLALLGAAVSFAITGIEGAWKLAISVTAGVGTVYIARWYWWRVTAWSEISAMAVAVVCTYLFSTLAAAHPDAGGGAVWLAAVPEAWLGFPFSAAATGLISLCVWVPVTLWTAPAPDAPHLRAFHDRVRPGGWGWVAVAGPDVPGPQWSTFIGIAASAAGVYGVLMSVGQLLVGRYGAAMGSVVLAMVGVAGAVWAISREVGRGARPVG